MAASTRQISGPAYRAIDAMLDCAVKCYERVATEDEARSARSVCCEYINRANPFGRCAVIVPVEYEDPQEGDYERMRFQCLPSNMLDNLFASAYEKWEKENPEWETRGDSRYCRQFERPVKEVTVLKLIDPHCAGYVTTTPDKFIENERLLDTTTRRFRIEVIFDPPPRDLNFELQLSYAIRSAKNIREADPHEQAQLKAMHFANFSRVVIRRMEQLMEEQLAAAQKELATYTESAAVISSAHKRKAQDESGEEERKKSRAA